MQTVIIAFVLVSVGSLVSALPTRDLAAADEASGTNFEEIPAEVNMELLPAAVVEQASPHIYYMNADGIAEPAENSRKLLIMRKRDVSSVKLPSSEGDEEIVQSDGGNFAVEAEKLGFRPARAYYARRYHKYPWNYH